MGQELVIKIEGLEELTKAMIVLAGSIQDHTAAMGKSVAPVIHLEHTGVAPDIETAQKDEDPDFEIATRDMYYYHKAKNSMLKIKKGEPIVVTVGYKATTKAKYDEYYGEDGTTEVKPGDAQQYDPDEDNGPEDGEDPVSMEDVRAKFVALDKATEKGAAKKILVALNVDKLMDMDPADYPKALKMAEDALKKAGK